MRGPNPSQIAFRLRLGGGAVRQAGSLVLIAIGPLLGGTKLNLLQVPRNGGENTVKRRFTILSS